MLLFSACGTTRDLLQIIASEGEQPADTTRAYTVYLIGDAGEPSSNPTEPSLRLLKRKLDEAGPNSAVVFLGDNIYPSGMPPPNAATRSDAERRINEQLAAVEDFEGQVVFVPGNHDWGGRGIGGSRTTLRRQEVYIEQALDRGNTFIPDRGFPGPVEVALNEEITLVALDTQWWLEPRRPFGDTGTYELEQEGSVLVQVDDLLRRNQGKKLIVVAHHPIFSNGSHGGFFQAGRRPIPLTRRYLGTPQDLSNYNYRRLREGLLAVFDQHESLVYAAGHEHSLQYFSSGGQHYVVSGSGTKSGYVAEERGASFVTAEKGFARLSYYTSGAVWLEFFVPKDGGEAEEVVYRVRIEKGTEPLTAFKLPTDESGDSLEVDETVVVSGSTENAEADQPDATNGDEEPAARPAPSPVPYAFASQGTVQVTAGDYGILGIFEWLLGSRYRDLWDTPVEVPIIDLENTAGGLTPLRKGGGFQTTSLRLQGGDGDQYVLRSVNKDPSKVLPEYLRETIAHDIVEDQNSAMHPYGAFVIAPMAEAAGIYHTTPTLVVIPDDPRLGIYQDEFAGMLALFEVRPDEEQRDELRFGTPEDIIGTPRLFEKLKEDNDDRVDAPFYVRNRLFDIFLGDWDRHSDQWRWAEFEPYELDPTLEGDARTQGKIYRAIPRDRDFVFFKFDGLLARLVKMGGGPAFEKFTNFGPEISFLKGLNYQSSGLDYRFTASLTEADWVAIAESLRVQLTDEVIEEAIRGLPEPAFARTGPFIIESLKARREQLPAIAARYYKMMARKVDIVGSDKHERFEVTRLNDRELEVVVIKTDKDGEPDKELFRRTFNKDETKEVRLYGEGGFDQFIFEGDVTSGIVVRAVGGFGEDTFIDENGDRGSRKNWIYDTRQGNTLEVGPRTKVRTLTDSDASAYQLHRFEPGAYAPVPYLKFSSDDQVILGGGIRYTNREFLTSPFKAQHTLAGGHSVATDAFNVYYKGVYTRSVGLWDGHLDANLYSNNSFTSFFGFGNGTDGSDAASDRFQAELTQIEVKPYLSKVPTPFSKVRIGPTVLYTNPDPLTNGPQPGTPASGFSADDFRDKVYVGLEAAFDVDGTDTLAVTRSGARWLNMVSVNQGVHNTNNFFVALESELSYFYTLRAPGTYTLAFRVGGGSNIGNFDFYQARYISGRSNVRGYAKNRFAGHSNFYNNIELRATLFDFNAYVARGDAGVLAFFDHGRVWADENDGGPWRAGYGGGVWVNPFANFIISSTYAFSSEGPELDFFLRFLF